MKKLIAIALALVASTASAAITGSSHDLRVKVAGTYAGVGSCTYCHMPHGANTAAAGAPIWSKTVRTTYTMYPTLKSGTTVAATPNAVTQACLSCHDGTANAVITQYNGALLAPSFTIPAGDNLGSDLRGDHPVSFTFNSNSTAVSGVPSALPAPFVLFTNAFECSSCHDPHNGTPTAARMLRSAAADICIACHTTK